MKKLTLMTNNFILVMSHLLIINFFYMITQFIIIKINLRIMRSQFDFPWPSGFWSSEGCLSTYKVDIFNWVLLGNLILLLPSILIYMTYDLLTGWVFLFQIILCILPTIIVTVLGYLIALGGALRATG